MQTVSPAVAATTRGRVRVLSLNRPGRSNSFAPDLVEALMAELKRVADDEAVNVVVLTGSGRAFSAGLDLKHLATIASSGEREAYLLSVFDVFRAVWNLPQPVLAAVNGAAVAGGFDLCVFCDFRVAADEAVFSQTEVLIGVNPIPTLLYHIVGLGHAKELGMTAARIPASEAHRIGLVNHVYPATGFLDRALELADRVASNPRSAVIETKRLTREMLEKSFDESLRDAGARILHAMETPAFGKRLGAYLAQLGSKGGPGRA